MTIQWGDTGRASFGTLKTLNISPYVSEQNITSTELTVGSSSTMPGGITPAVSFTINTTTMAPTFSGANVLSYKPVYGMNLSGQNTNGAAQTVYYQINKNGASYKTGNVSCSNTNYFTVSLIDATPVNGDKFDFYVWTPASTGVTYSYQNIFCLPSRIDTGVKNMVNYALTISSMNSLFTLTGKFVASSTGNVYFYPSTSTMTAGTGSSTTLPMFQSHATYKLFGIGNGDSNGTSNAILQSATAYPGGYYNYYPSQIQYRDLFF